MDDILYSKYEMKNFSFDDSKVYIEMWFGRQIYAEITRHRSDGKFYIKVLENKEIPVEYLLHFIESAKEFISNNTHYLDDV
jgi:hypothetical protein